MDIQSLPCVNGEIVSKDDTVLLSTYMLYVAEPESLSTGLTGGTGALPDVRWFEQDSAEAPSSGACDLGADDPMPSEVLEAIRIMEEAYERADRGEDVDWDDLIYRYGVG